MLSDKKTLVPTSWNCCILLKSSDKYLYPDIHSQPKWRANIPLTSGKCEKSVSNIYESMNR